MMKNKTWITLTGLLMTLVLGCILFPNTTKAAEIPSSETVIKTYTGSVNGVERTLFITETVVKQKKVYIKVGETEPHLIAVEISDAGFDQYGAVWIKKASYPEVRWWSHDLTPVFSNIVDFTPIGREAESLSFNGSGEQAIVTGYKTASGEEYPLLAFSSMRTIAAPDSSIPEPLYIPKGMEGLITPRPATPTPTPKALEPSTPTPKSSSKKVSIKTEKKAKVLYEGDEFIGQYTLKKGVLNWKSPKKKGKMKGVKQVGFNKKTKKLVILTKKGDGYVLSFKNGKKKRVVRKKGRSFIYSGKFVTKIKTVSGKIDLSKK